MNPKTGRYFTYIRPIIRNKFAVTYSPLIFSLITIGIFSYYAIRPTVQTILSLQKSIDEQTTVLNRLQEKVGKLAEGKQNYENINPDIKEKLENLVPDNPSLPQIINSLSYIANQSEASISGLQFQSVTLDSQKNIINKDASIEQIDFTLNIQGSFANLMSILSSLKRADRLITIKTINFVKPADKSLIMSITGMAYYLKN